MQENGIYIVFEGKTTYVPPPKNGFGQTTVSWANGKPTHTETKETNKLNYK
ncbi:TPA_asm: DUF3954 domain-containing protein [Listeria monocytogenes]|nr:DUF3954 domain-containing protein [Listeria monocytogenes]